MRAIQWICPLLFIAAVLAEPSVSAADDDKDVLSRIAQLESRIAALEAENLALNRKISNLLAKVEGTSNVIPGTGDQVDDALSNEIARGIERQLNFVEIPLGDITIMSGLSSQAEKNDFRNKRFKADMLGNLKKFEAAGIVSLREQKQSALEEIRRVGAKTVTVAATARANGFKDNEQSTQDLLAIQVATCKLLKIVQDEPYSSDGLPKSEKFRLIVGSYQLTRTDAGRVINPGSELRNDYKFRALLKYDPFKNKYIFQIADWGIVGVDQWFTGNIR